MKIQSLITAGLLILSTSVIPVNAQQIDDPAVKILPTAQKGILKVLFAYDTDQSVNVKFYNEEGELALDKIKGGTFHNGFSKKYNVRKLSSGNFWVEVSTATMSVTYKITESRGGQTYTPLLEKTSYNHPLVASNSY